MESNSSSGEEEFMDIDEAAKNITNDLLPKKSQIRYNQIYNNFMAWRQKKKINTFSENVFLIYFHEMSQNLRPNTMWSKWSMLRSVMCLHHGINLNEYQKLKTFLKSKSKGFEQKKSKVLTWNDVTKFLNEANDREYLVSKVILIFGISGALRTIEFCNLNYTDIDDTGEQLLVTIRDTKNDYPRNFIIGERFYGKVKQYMALRPQDIESQRFFLHYQEGKCTRNVIGKNKIGETPNLIATYLKLENPHLFTGHCFRRTAATLLANSGASIVTLKQLGGWKSNTVAEGYVENSVHNKKMIFNAITNQEKDILPDKDGANISTTISKNSTETNINENNNSSDWPENDEAESEWFKNIDVDVFYSSSDGLTTDETLNVNISTDSGLPLKSIENCPSSKPSVDQPKVKNIFKESSTENDKNSFQFKSSSINLTINTVHNLTINYNQFGKEEEKSTKTE